MSALRRSAPMTFLVYVVTAALATLPSWPTASALTPPAGPDPGGGRLIESLIELRPMLSAGLTVALGCVVLAMLLSPWLTMSWLSSLRQPTPLSRAVGDGARDYLRALGIRLVLLPVLAIALALTFGLPLLASALSLPDPRTTLALAGLLALPGLVLLLVWGAWQDLAQARLSRDPRIFASLRGSMASLRPRTLATYLGFLALGALLSVSALIVVARLDVGAGVIAGVALAQVLTLARTAVRAQWLGYALTRTSP